jgi:hypothetical protein
MRRGRPAFSVADANYLGYATWWSSTMVTAPALQVLPQLFASYFIPCGIALATWADAAEPGCRSLLKTRARDLFRRS